jgi:hypothetical protein
MALAREPPRLGDKFGAASIIYREAFDRSKTPKLKNKTFIINDLIHKITIQHDLVYSRKRNRRQASDEALGINDLNRAIFHLK